MASGSVCNNTCYVCNTCVGKNNAVKIIKPLNSMIYSPRKKMIFSSDNNDRSIIYKSKIIKLNNLHGTIKSFFKYTSCCPILCNLCYVKPSY